MSTSDKHEQLSYLLCLNFLMIKTKLYEAATKSHKPHPNRFALKMVYIDETPVKGVHMCPQVT